MLADLTHRFRALFRREAVERELDEELRLHLEHETGTRLAAGMPREEAARQARLAVGGFDQIKEAHRDARGVRAIESILQDLRYGARTLRHTPLFAVTSVMTLALSTAALATVLTLAHTLFVRRLPVPRAEEVVAVSGTRIRWNPDRVAVRDAERLRTLGPVSYPDYVSFRDRATTVTGLAAHYPTAPLFVSANGNVKEINGAVVSANFFRLLGLEPVSGRFFHDAEDRVPDRDRVAVISSNLWRSWFAASPGAIGSHVRINSVDFTVVGVASSEFVGTTPIPIEIYIPTMMLRVGYRWCDDALAADCAALQMIGRLAPGQTLASAAAELPTVMPEAWRHARAGENSGVAVTDLRGMSEDDNEPRLVAILAGVAILLLAVCCANLAGLSSAQSAARAGEFAVRLSLGAGPGRVVRQLATEWVMLGAAGGMAGVLLARAFTSLLAAAFFAADDEGHPLRYAFGQTPAIGSLTIGAALVAALVISVGPAISAVRRAAPGAATPRFTAPRRWTGAWLLGAQATAAVAMVALAALFAVSAQAMVSGGNYDGSHLALLRLRPRLLKYPPERAQRFQREVVERLAALPSVESVSLVGIGAVLDGGAAAIALPVWTAGQQARARFNEIGPRYFATLQTPIVSGREFDDTDLPRSPHVAIVNETLAARLWPDGRALGATLLVNATPHRIVGIVRDIRLGSRTAPPESWVYTPFWQNTEEIDSRLAIRIGGDPAAMLPALVREVNRVDRDVPISEPMTMPMRMAGLKRPVRIGAAFVGYAAALAVLLTGVGLFGTLSFAVARRTREIGIRMALGAARARIVGAIVRDGLVVVGSGAVAGIAAAVATTRVVRHLLYGSAAADWLYFVGAAALVVLVGLCACVVPARRAARVEPIVALRCE
jgi:putative ABC transport system permease protein